MVNIEKNLSELLENIYDSDKNDIENLKLIVKKYPFFQAAHILLAKKLYDIDSPSKKKALEFAAIYSIDRQKLKKFINSKQNLINVLNTNKNISKNSKSYIKKDLSHNLNLSIHKNTLFTEEEVIDDSYFTDEIISESLAKIMVQQGKTDLAIKIYNRLILKLPQKKAYFVRIVNKLKTKL